MQNINGKKSIQWAKAHEEILSDPEVMADYDSWFHEQVKISIDDPRPSIPHEEAKKIFAAKRESVLKRCQ